MFEQKKQVILL